MESRELREPPIAGLSWSQDVANWTEISSIHIVFEYNEESTQIAWNSNLFVGNWNEMGSEFVNYQLISLKIYKRVWWFMNIS